MLKKKVESIVSKSKAIRCCRWMKMDGLFEFKWGGRLRESGGLLVAGNGHGSTWNHGG